MLSWIYDKIRNNIRENVRETFIVEKIVENTLNDWGCIEKYVRR